MKRRRKRQPLGISTPEELRQHRELEYLRAAGNQGGPTRRRKHVTKDQRAGARNWLRIRRRKLDGTP